MPFEGPALKIGLSWVHCVHFSKLSPLSVFLPETSFPFSWRTASLRKVGISSAGDPCMAAGVWLHGLRGAGSTGALMGYPSHTVAFGS